MTLIDDLIDKRELKAKNYDKYNSDNGTRCMETLDDLKSLQSQPVSEQIEYLKEIPTLRPEMIEYLKGEKIINHKTTAYTKEEAKIYNEGIDDAISMIASCPTRLVKQEKVPDKVVEINEDVYMGTKAQSLHLVYGDNTQEKLGRINDGTIKKHMSGRWIIDIYDDDESEYIYLDKLIEKWFVEKNKCDMCGEEATRMLCEDHYSDVFNY